MGTDDTNKRRELRDAIRQKFREFNEQYMATLIEEYKEINVTLNCYLIDPVSKDIDNLAKIPIDAVFFSLTS